VQIRKEEDMKKLVAMILAFIIILTPCLVSCGEDEEIPYVVLTKANVILSVGDEYTLGAKVYPEKYSDLAIDWTSANNNVVTCEDGKLKAHAAGSAVITASVNGGNAFTATVTVLDGVREHINLLVGESATIKETSYKNIFEGDFEWESTNTDAVVCDGSSLTANAIGNSVIRIRKGEDLVSVCSVSVFENIESMVEFTAPELPVSISYKSGVSAVEVQDFSYTVTEDARGLMVSFTVSYQKTADISGTQSKNATGFYIELYSAEVGYCTTYKVESNLLFVGESATFQSNFIADVSNGMRHFNIVLLPIE
jgi:uncharacterized protein YjdB